MRYTFFLLLIVVLGASCVPNKKILYLQSENEFTDHPKDTVLRTYNLANYEYRIQPEDILSIRVKSITADEFDILSNSGETTPGSNVVSLGLSGYLVNAEGTITLTGIGAVKVAGLTLHEIRKKLESLAVEYVEDPIVSVRVLNFRATVLGEVNAPGVVSNYNNRVTLIEVLAQAGGLSELADRSSVKIIRQVNGESKVLYVNVLEEDLMKQPSFFVHQNDIIVVPPLRQRAFRRYFGQNVSLFVSSMSTLLLIINLLNR